MLHASPLIDRILCLASLLLVLTAATAARAQTVFFVDADAAGKADGSSWTDAFLDLQDALAVAEAGDEVWVARGTYRPTDAAEGGSADRDASFVLPNGVRLFGGFNGSEGTREGRDLEANETVLSGDIGVRGDMGDNAFHIVVASDVDSTTVLDGFTITGGNGNGATPRNRGGGIYAENSSLVVRNARIVANQVVQTDGFGGGGGAFFGTSGAPRFERVVFERNGLNAIGGGLWLFRTFEADTSGAAPLSAVLRDVAFVENNGSFGGGVRSTRARLVIVQGRFERNAAIFAGGGLGMSQEAGHFTNVGFYGNVVPESSDLVNGGGGIWGSGSTLTFTNVVFVGNTARLGGGFLGGGETNRLTNTTFADNRAEEGGGIRFSGREAAVSNSVLWKNTGNQLDIRSGNVTFSHTLIMGGCPPDRAKCESLLDADPLFVRAPDPGPDGAWGTPDDDYGDLRLQEESPAVDFGRAALLPPDTFDLDADGDTAEPLPFDLAGEPRLMGDEVDLGAHERPGPVATEPFTSPVASVVLDAYPNPARGPVTVALWLERPQRTEITVYDLQGRRVTVLHDDALAAGVHAFRLDTASLPAGAYLLRFEGAAESLTRRLVVLR